MTVLAAVWLLLISPVLGATLRGFPAVAGITLDAIAAGWLIAWVHHAPGRLATAGLGRGYCPRSVSSSTACTYRPPPFLSPTGWLASGKILLPWLAAITAAALSYWLVEKPVLRFKSRLNRAALISSPVT